jgi:hypothetical protein
LEAIHLAITLTSAGDVKTTLRGVMENLGSSVFDSALARVRESLQLAMS